MWQANCSSFAHVESNFACTQEDLTELIPSHLSSPLALPNLPGVEENIEVRACTIMLPRRHPAAA